MKDPDLTREDRSKAVGRLREDRSYRGVEARADLGAPQAIEGEALSPGEDPCGGIDLFTSDNHLRSLAEIEADIIRLAIGHYRGRMSEVARRLGIGRSTLYRKLSEMGIETSGR